jgi:hypothetical protein
VVGLVMDLGLGLGCTLGSGSSGRVSDGLRVRVSARVYLSGERESKAWAEFLSSQRAANRPIKAI